MKRSLAGLILIVTLAARAGGLGEPLVFTGMCDASAAVALDADLFVAANDEDNILRCYSRSQPGKPVFSYNLNPLLAGRQKSPEADLEGAARVGTLVYWITSHGRNTQGEPKPARCRFFALEFAVHGTNITVQPVGRVYSDLVKDLTAEPKLARFDLKAAAELPPKARGGLNIEALTDTPEGTLLIGFRSPIPQGRALLVPLLNPNDLLAGQPPRFGDPILLDLGGLGLRGSGSTRRGYYLIAGPDSGKAESRLFFWAGGTATPQPVLGASLPGINPEAMCFHDIAGATHFLILSDDGSRMVNGKACKDLPESQREFRAYHVSP